MRLWAGPGMGVLGIVVDTEVIHGLAGRVQDPDSHVWACVYSRCLNGGVPALSMPADPGVQVLASRLPPLLEGHT